MNFSSSLKYIVFGITLSTFTACGGGSGGEDSITNTNNIINNSSSDTSNSTPIATPPAHVSNVHAQEFEQGVHIDELLPSNATINFDTDFYAFSDWIELYNNSDEVVDIGGYYLSNDKNNTKLWQIPANTTIDAQGYLLIWADKEDMVGKELHTNFGLSSKKAKITFADRSGSIIDTIKYKGTKGDVSIANTQGEVLYMTPTPNAKNGEILTQLLPTPEPEFIYNGSDSLMLRADNGASIYYTTDGSTPTTKSTLYTEAINIDKTETVRAVALESDHLLSSIASNTYFVNEVDTNLPIFAVAMNSEYLYDDMIGIYVEGKNGAPLKQCSKSATVPVNYGQEWRRPASIEYFDSSRQKIVSFDSDISIAGGCSRKVSKKSFKLELGKKYGTSSLENIFFDDKPNMKSLKSLKLRVGYEGLYILDMLAAALVKDAKLDVDYQEYKTVQMFLNGDYWGIYNIRESKDTDYLKSNHPEINRKNLDIINRGNRIKKGDMVEYNKLFDYIKNSDLSTAENYNTLATMVDIDSYMDYMIVMIYVGNTDWIWANHRCWRERKEGAKWRWILDDIDLGFRAPANKKNYFDVATGSGPMITKLLRGLLTNSAFKAKFKTKFNNLLNSTFDPVNVNRIIDELIAPRKNYMSIPAHWPAKEQKFNDYVDGELRDFVNQRKDILASQLDAL